MADGILVSIEHGDILAFDADLIALKYAQGLHGVDLAVAKALGRAGLDLDRRMPAPGAYLDVETTGTLHAPRVLFVGVPPLWQFGYPEIRTLAGEVLAIALSKLMVVAHLAMTLHGVGNGLDELEAALAQLSGYADSVAAGRMPTALRRISIVERDGGRVQRLRQGLDRVLPGMGWEPRGEGCWCYPCAAWAGRAGADRSVPSAAVVPTPEKPHAFIAMPYKAEMDDVFYYGIQAPVHANGLLCERVDKEVFTGDILARIRERIESAAVVIAEMTGANPNVYLELGYAWGRGRPTILLATGPNELLFDVRGQRCLIYSRIRELEEKLAEELAAFKAHGIV